MAVLKSEEYKLDKTDDHATWHWRNFYSTRTFISLLPLPETVKEFMNEVAKEICQYHPQQNWVPGNSVGESDHGSNNDISWPIIDLV